MTYWKPAAAITGLPPVTGYTDITRKACLYRMAERRLNTIRCSLFIVPMVIEWHRTSKRFMKIDRGWYGSALGEGFTGWKRPAIRRNRALLNWECRRATLG